MAAQEVLHPRIEEEAQEDPSREAQHHHERHQRAHRAPDAERAEVRPVHLPLLPGQGAKPQVRLGRCARAQRGHEVAKMIGAARVAARTHHRVQPARREARVLAQCLLDERQVRIELRGAHKAGRARHPVLREHPVHGVVVHAELAADRARWPALGMIEAQDLGFEFPGYGQRSVLLCSGGRLRHPVCARGYPLGCRGTPRRWACVAARSRSVPVRR